MKKPYRRWSVLLESLEQDEIIVRARTRKEAMAKGERKYPDPYFEAVDADVIPQRRKRK